MDRASAAPPAMTTLPHQAIPESIRTLGRLGALSAADRAVAAAESGSELLNLHGAPILPMPPHVQEAVARALREPDPRPTRGLGELREAISTVLATDYGVEADPDNELLITHGAMHGLSIVLTSLLEPGDEVLIPSPTFMFEGHVRLAGGSPIYILSPEASGWRWDPESVEAAISARTRVLLLCNPTNPTGYLPTHQEVDSLVDIASRHGIVVVADESFQRFTFDGRPFVALATRRNRHPNLVTVTSLSKNYAFASWRVGYVHAPTPLLDQFLKVFEWTATNCGYVAQKAALAAITGPQTWLTDCISNYERKRDLVYAAVERSGAVSAVRPQAGPFMLLNCSRLGSTEEAIQGILLASGIPTVPGRHFGGPSTHVRLLFGSSDEVLEDLVQQINRLGARRGALGVDSLA